MTNNQASNNLKTKWDKRIKFLRDNSQHLNEWEEEFLLVMESKRHFKGDLTPREVHKVYEIYHKIEWKLG